MNSRKIKHKIALSCNGDLRKYFNKVNLINNEIIKKNSAIKPNNNRYINANNK